MSTETIFDFINAINYKKEIKYNEKVASAYLLMLWFSHDRTLLPLLNKINKHIFNIEGKVVYNYLYQSVPAGKRFLKWVKKVQVEKEKNLEEELEEYNLSKREIMLYSKFIK